MAEGDTAWTRRVVSALWGLEVPLGGVVGVEEVGVVLLTQDSMREGPQERSEQRPEGTSGTCQGRGGSATGPAKREATH